MNCSPMVMNPRPGNIINSLQLMTLHYLARLQAGLCISSPRLASNTCRLSRQGLVPDAIYRALEPKIAKLTASLGGRVYQLSLQILPQRAYHWPQLP